MKGRNRPIPSAISDEAKAFFETVPPLKAWPITLETIDEVRRTEREGCAPHS